MNPALIFHLIRRDLGSRRGGVIALWILLAGYATRPLWLKHGEAFSMTSPWLLIGEIFWMAAMLWLMMSLQLDFIQADHPRDSSAFLHTRPVGRANLLLAKFLGWAAAAAVPALASVMVNLALLRLDLRPGDYGRVALRDTLLLAGVYGLLSALAVVLRGRRVVIFLSLLVMALSMTVLSCGEHVLWENLRPEALHFWALEESRQLAAWQLALGLGYVMTGCMLARATLPTVIAWLVAGAGLCLLVLWFWPVNLVWRNDRIETRDPARLAQLQKLTGIQVAGELTLLSFHIRSQESPRKPEYDLLQIRSDPLRITGDSGVEFPEPVSYDATVKLPEGRQWQRSMRQVGVTHVNLFSGAEVLVQSPLDREGIYPPLGQQISSTALARVLGLPLELAEQLRYHSRRVTFTDRGIVLAFESQQGVASGTSVPVSGRATLDWIRPEVIARLPLKAGSSFTRDGHRVAVRATHVGGHELRLGLSVSHCRSLVHEEWAYDSNPDFILWVVNPSRGHIALTRPVSQHSSYSPLQDVESMEAEVSFEIMAVAGKFVGTTTAQQWLDEARLYVLARRHIGQTEQDFAGDLTINQLSLTKPPHAEPKTSHGP